MHRKYLCENEVIFEYASSIQIYIHVEHVVVHTTDSTRVNAYWKEAMDTLAYYVEIMLCLS